MCGQGLIVRVIPTCLRASVPSRLFRNSAKLGSPSQTGGLFETHLGTTSTASSKPRYYQPTAPVRLNATPAMLGGIFPADTARLLRTTDGTSDGRRGGRPLHRRRPQWADATPANCRKEDEETAT
jgi:hypothetical protein